MQYARYTSNLRTNHRLRFLFYAKIMLATEKEFMKIMLVCFPTFDILSELMDNAPKITIAL